MQDKVVKHKTKYGISINGDCLYQLKHMPSNYVDMILTDPPYGINYQSNGRKNKMRRILNDDNDFRFLVYDEFERVMKDDSTCCVFCSWKNFSKDYEYLSNIFKVLNVIVWHKPGGGFGDLKHTLLTDYELCIVCAKGNPTIYSKRNGSVISVKKVNHGLMKHPTEKPVDLYRYIIQTWTKKGDIVLDCFAGSFVNAIACIKTERKYICIELDKTYYKQGVKRIENELL